MATQRKMLRGFDLRRIRDAEWVAGVDEAGRGCLAGPVVAGAVLVHRSFYEGHWCRRHAREINDSKQLDEARREAVYRLLPELVAEGLAFYAAGLADAREVDSLNVLGATRQAMRRALHEAGRQAAGWVRLPEKGVDEGLFDVAAQGLPVALVMVDGLPLKPFPYEHSAIVQGDGKSLVIALASIVAKVTRDRLMCGLDEDYPQYGFARHKGYGTVQHREALREHGPCELHRASFLGKILECEAGPDLQSGFDFAALSG
ncbi:MAG: ribonuclease HII [Opitutales bacterium]|nr:ribonuclease HII [Opitutales bacterium]